MHCVQKIIIANYQFPPRWNELLEGFFPPIRLRNGETKKGTVAANWEYRCVWGLRPWANSNGKEGYCLR